MQHAARPTAQSAADEPLPDEFRSDETPSDGMPLDVLRPLSARSVVLSLLLGADPPELALRDLAQAVADFGVSSATLRVALSRMTAAAELDRVGEGVYRLTGRLLERKSRQDEAVHPALRDWDGEWELAVVTATGRTAAERAQLRGELAGLRLAELREGVWLRPANLARPWPAEPASVLQRLSGRPEGSPRALAASLWPLDAWSATGHELLRRFRAADTPAERFVLAAAVVRHLVTDPVLPAELLPEGWPGAALRAAYTCYQRELAQLRSPR